MLKSCLSGQELCDHGFEQDVQWASELSVERHVPMLRELSTCYVDFGVTDMRVKHQPVKYYEKM